MKTRHKRLLGLLGGVAAISVAAFLILQALDESLLYFRSPSEVALGQVRADRSFRLGGMVKEGTVEYLDDLHVRFVVTDYAHDLPVEHQGTLPDLFREGQGVVADGQLDAQGHFVAARVLAKHDEEYMPPEVARALEQGRANRPDS